MSIPLFKVYMPEGVNSIMKEVLASGYIAEGDYVRAFEQSLKTFFKNDNIVTTNSCTHSIHLSLALAGVKPGDYVYCTPMTCIATAVPIANIGAIPIWVDVDPKHGMITPETLDVSIRKGRKYEMRHGAKVSKEVVIYVCWGGDLGPLPEVAKYCSENDITLIVDAAQAFGVEYEDGKRLGDGTLGDYTCFSCQAIKHITTGDGGILALKDPKQYKKAFNKKWFGIDREAFRTPTGEINWDADVPEIGFKFHMNNIAGCIGGAQMLDPTLISRLDKYIGHDRLLTYFLDNEFIKRSWNGDSASWVSTFNCDRPKELQTFLLGEGIFSSQMHSNIDVYTGFKSSHPINDYDRPGVVEFMKTHLCLPCGWWVSGDDLFYIINRDRKSVV